MNDKTYCDIYQKYIELIQKHEVRTTKVHLLFAPIGSNVLFLADQLRENTCRGRKTAIVNGAYDSDLTSIDRFNRLHGTQHQTLPWVLQRYDGHQHAERPWEIWFRSLDDNECQTPNDRGESKRLKKELLKEKSRPNRACLEWAVCVDYVTRFNDATSDWLAEAERPANPGSMAVHIRRGDACTEALDIQDPERDNHTLNVYIEEIEKLCDQGFTRIYTLTESQLEIDHLRERLAGRCEVLSQEMDRSQFLRIKKSSYDPKNFVEYQALGDPAFAKMLMESALIDLYNAQACTAFVGTFSSQFSVMTYLKIVGYHQKLVPLVNLSDTPFDGHFNGYYRPWKMRMSRAKMHLRFAPVAGIEWLKKVKCDVIRSWCKK